MEKQIAVQYVVTTGFHYCRRPEGYYKDNAIEEQELGTTVKHSNLVSGQRHSTAALYPRGKGPSVPIVQEAGWAPEPVWTHR
jgi:hypothetical protein